MRRILALSFLPLIFLYPAFASAAQFSFDDAAVAIPPASEDVGEMLRKALLPPTPPATTSTRVSAHADTTAVAPQVQPQVADRVAALQELILQLTKQLKSIMQARKQSSEAPKSNSAICTLTRTLGRGMQGDDVAALQRFLVGEGVLSADGASGFFGALTERGVQEWQTKNGVIGHGSPSATGFGVVGVQTRAIMQRACQTSSPAPLISPAPDTESNIPSAALKNVRLTLEVQGNSFRRGQHIPVKVTILDPIPYTGADVEFMQVDSDGATNTFGAQVYLPVGFKGEIEHQLNASHVDIRPKDAAIGNSTIKLRALVEAKFRDTDYGGDITKTFGLSEWTTLNVGEDKSSGQLTFSANGITLSGNANALQFFKERFKNGNYGDILSSFAATTTSRSNAIEYCGTFSEVLNVGISFTCMWNNEDVSPEIYNRTKTIPVSAVSPSSNTLGAYFMYKNDVITGTDLAISRAEALQNCALNHSKNPSATMRCVWNNEIIYNKGPLSTKAVPADIEPGAAPFTVISP